MFLKERYEKDIKDKLMTELNYDNPMQVPKVEKVVVNMGVSNPDNPKVLEQAMENLRIITGQKPVLTRASKSISDFEIRRGVPVGCKVTLRKNRAYEFIKKLIHVVLPSIRDFRGLSSDSFDGRGNYSLGLDEQLVFPEIVYNDIEEVQGMDITVTTTAETDQEGFHLLNELGFPFRE